MEFVSSSVCRSCRSRLTSTRSIRGFSTTISNRIVPPESPTYIDVPSTYQADLPVPKREKGILPVPRELFPARRPDKPSQQYLDNLTKSPLPKNETPYETLSELGKYRHRMAQLRKKHVREGLTGLHKRKTDTVAKIAHKSQSRQAERARLIAQAPREDARLTNNSVPQAMRAATTTTSSTTPIADDLAAAKALHERKVANYDATVAAKSEERLDALHTLYMNARSFITTEQQLDIAIEQQFDTATVFRNDGSSGKSMWHKGPPDTVRIMIANNQGQEQRYGPMLATMRGRQMESSRIREQRDQDRMKKIAEKLSGGKI